MKGRVVKGVGGSYQVSDGVCSLECSPRGRLKREDRLAVGDWVEVSEQGGEGVVERVYPRRNALIRPFLANVDQMLLLVTSSPMADLLLIDKLLILCAMQEIPVYLAINKQDINPPGFCERILSDYRDACGGLLELSALCGGRPEELTALLSGKLTCLAGQSAVGKSTLLNLLAGLDVETGNLSAKIERGRHTTRHSEIFALGENTFVADTPGFSSLELELDPRELWKYYPDFARFDDGCRYRGCTHRKEPQCAVRDACERGELSTGRYERYTILFEQLEKSWERRFEKR